MISREADLPHKNDEDDELCVAAAAAAAGGRTISQGRRLF